MAAHHLRIVGEKYVAGKNVFLAPMRELGFDRVRQPADKHRQPQADRNRVAVGIEQADGEIFGFIDNHVVGGAHEIGLHLIGDRHYRAADHLDGKGIHRGLAALGIANFRFHIPKLAALPCEAAVYSPT